MLTPAQKPRGLARIIFTRTSFPVGLSYPDRRGPPTVADRARKRHRHPARGGDAGWTRTRGGGSLVELDLADGDDVLLAVLGDLARHGPFLGLGADLAVVLLVAGGVEVVHHLLVVLPLDLDDGLALLGDLQVALGAG